MLTLCKLYSVKSDYFKVKFKKDKAKGFDREIEFYLVKDGKNYSCEVKLMGIGNPESPDAVIASASDIFIADKLSQQNKNQLDSLKVNWVELRSENGFKRFKNVLEILNIPHTDYTGILDIDLSLIFTEIFSD
jgi:hypothetical protein